MSTRKKFYLAKSNQEGGTIENDLKEFSKYLMELIGATTDEELQDFVKKQGPEKVNEIYKQWKEQVPMAKDGMQFVNNSASKAQNALVPGNVAIQNKIQDTVQDDLRGISSFKEAFAEARRRGLRQFSWGKGIYTTELAQPASNKQVIKKQTEEKSATPTNKKNESVNTVVEKKGEDTNREVPDSLKRRDTPTTAQTVSNRETTPTSVPTPLQPKDLGGLDDPIAWLKAVGAVGTGAAVVGTGLYYGSNKYDQYKAAKLRAARAASAPVAPTAELSAPARTPRVKARTGAVPRMLTAPPTAIDPLSRQWKYDAPTTAPATESATESAAPRVKARATSGTLTARPSAPKFGSTSRWEGWKYDAPAVESAPVAPPAPPAQPTPPTALRARATAGTGAAAPSAPARTLRVKARAGAMARTVTAPPAAPPSAPAGSTARWEGWKYDATPKFEGTTPKPEVKPEATAPKPKAATAPKPRGKFGKATAPKPGGKPRGMSGKSFRPGRTTSLASRMAGRANMLGMALGLISDLFPSKEAVELNRDAWEAAKVFGINRDDVTEKDVNTYRMYKNKGWFKEGGKMNKLDYINKLNGECPEGYTAVKFAKGGVICTTCQKNKEVAAKKKNHLDAIKEEMKCGGKMKSHQKGGEMTNAQYRKAPLSKKVDQDLRDQATGKNAGEGGTPKTDSIKAAPKKLIKKPTKK